MINLQNNNQIKLDRELNDMIQSAGRHGSPCAGFSLASKTEIRAGHIREAVEVLANGLQKNRIEFDSAKVYLPIVCNYYLNKNRTNSVPTQLAWNLVSIWLISKLGREWPSNHRFFDAESWFLGNDNFDTPHLSSLISVESLLKAEQILDKLIIDNEFKALLPYILEEHGPGSRISVMKDPTTSIARSAKRAKGVFYTPSDVADYMVEHVRKLYRGDFFSAKCIDPACGTGVFLLAMLRAVVRHHGKKISVFDYVTSCLHGLDISGQALDGAAFILLLECLTEVQTRGITPYTAWQSIRRNLVEIDAVTVDTFQNDNAHLSLDMFSDPLPRLGKLFPKISDGFEIFIGNPPYAAIGERADYKLLATRFHSLNGVRVGPKVNLFPLFIEMMCQFTKSGSNASALVTPLSIAFHSGRQYKNCRKSMGFNGGKWRFVFFDREPHALFGEEVKTRNAIIFRSENFDTPKRGQTAIIETGPLRKWTSRTRASLFQSIDFTPLDSVTIINGIPKLGGSSQAEAFLALKRSNHRFPTFPLRFGTCAPAEAISHEDRLKVIVGGTAYNFLNVYCPIKLKLEKCRYPLSESSVHFLEFKTEMDAKVAFAILSSHLIFWLWHVLGDGFHVASWFFKEIPFSRDSFTNNEVESLSRLGNLLWEKIQRYRFVSVNGGRQTIGFRPLACYEEINKIDAILVKASGLEEEFTVELRRFVHDNAVVDSTDKKRNHIIRHFTKRV